jgi:hypothetical protein
MDTVSSIICKAFLDNCPAEKRRALLEILPKEEKQKIEALPQTFQNPLFGGLTSKQQLDRIHYSWFASYLRTFTENEIQLFITVLNENQARGVRKALLLSDNQLELTSVSKTFLEKTLLEKTAQDKPDLLPIACLPESPLNVLLSLQLPEFIRLFDFLGIHDLAYEIKQIIETAKLKKIYSVLSPEELSFLKTLLHQKETLAFKPIGIQQWDGDVERLKSILHQRGINRLAKALYQEDPSLVWYISHQLDVERAAILLKLSTDLQNLRAVHLLIQQVVDCLTYLQTKKSESSL